MCGIVGLWDRSQSSSKSSVKNICAEMANKLIHRGPDSKGTWIGSGTNISFGFQRLAILDLSESGHQPMHSPDTNLTIAFNGEIYNHLQIREELNRLGYNFRGHSDTETIICAFQQWGIEKALAKFVGMFAIALWSEKEKKLYLIRDRMGIKPLYWTQQNDIFAFSSELKAFKKCSNLEFQIDRPALSLFLRYGYIPAPHCIFQNFHKLEPGTILCIGENSTIEQKKFWDLEQVLEKAKRNKFSSPDDVVDQLHETLKTAVQDRLLSDVPLGTLLSGGIDSSTIAALTQEHSSQPISTFSIGFQEENYNEAQHAKAIAKFLGTKHTELYVSATDAISVIPKMGKVYDEPFADSSQIPTYLVSELAKKEVTVALSGDGGDELFGGYRRYDIMNSVWTKTSAFSPFACKLFIKAIQKLPKRVLASPYGMDLYTYTTKLADKASGLTQLKSYQKHLSQYLTPEDLILSDVSELDIFNDETISNKLTDLQDLMQFIDSKLYLPDDILTKVDRASMAHSLELRVPIIDHRVVELAWRIPSRYRYMDGVGKWPLRQVLYKYIPKELVDRPKSGFNVPVKYWLKNELFAWGDAYLSKEYIQKQVFFNPSKVEHLWQQHQNGGANNFPIIWCLLMFQEWYQNWNEND
ncbi:asparagine synthase (glutamine-hydrolyzing) [Curvivirga aplysinae]|uniref:asparagine synthase (glutamine-hydrolyzing) n=1 Tax=Curvivirga aplysinae TaxID=2529852 RepID=UPI0012BC98EA|nr:asparagine synthase (glutamine-hydrolyzing) [Curvivirga aplysinae]MTI11385.1 asparagine synthase (glutamine-hydrolyzing) [Curvivirga aplysinae]